MIFAQGEAAVIPLKNGGDLDPGGIIGYVNARNSITSILSCLMGRFLFKKYEHILRQITDDNKTRNKSALVFSTDICIFGDFGWVEKHRR